MIPIRDNIATRTFPIITVSIIFVNILIFLWMRFALTGMEGQTVYKYFGLVPREFITSVYSRLDLVPYNVMTVFSSMFLHGGFFHIGGNMLYLWIFGNNIEDAMGHGRFLVFYLLAGIVAAFAQLLYDLTSNIPMIGASGAVSGVLGAYLVLYPYARIKTLLFIIIFIKIVELPA
ncbi:MAG: rhomboid family protein, partial [Deltaproteobacteria bacterium]|nr:rhomboid family protein [Deltaproteobacteria bacterium]